MYVKNSSVYFLVLSYLHKSALLRKNLVALNQTITKILYKKKVLTKFKEVLIEARNDMCSFFILFDKFH